MSALDVYLHGARVGVLERREQARLRFAYSEDALERGARLSLSLPPRAEPFEDAECRPFFAGLLPEGEFLRRVARAFGVSAGNPFSLLAAIGGECAGAVSLVAPGEPLPAERGPDWLDGAELHKLIASLPTRPLLAGGEDEGLRLSLAGAQEKLPVVFAGGRVGITHGNPPSTHIIKLPDPRFADLVANEAYCLALARAAGLAAVEASPRIVQREASLEALDDDLEYLLVVRYDRAAGDGGADRRIHQEDLCQALGVVAELKYESDGGPGVAACAELLRRHASAPAIDLLAFLDALIFNFVVGNHDAHAKNHSLLLGGSRAPRLAPLYDLLSTAAYEGLSRKLAMKFGGEYRPEYVRGRHLERLADDLGMGAVGVRDRVRAMLERVAGALDEARAEIGEFADRPVLDRIDGIVRERSKLLAEAAAEV